MLNGPLLVTERLILRPPAAEDFDNYLLTGEIGVEAAISDHLSLRVVVQDKYDNTPAPGAERNDLSLIAGLGLSL